MPRVSVARNWPVLLALAITVYAGLLRLDAYVAKYGTIESPGWARLLTTGAAPVGTALRPYERGWPPEPTPYVGGDPVNYIRFAREMTSFYQPHVREPVFLATTRAYLWLLGGQDAAVSFASATGSLLAVFGTYMLAAMLMPRIAALAAAFLLAADHEVITWAVDGWRDDVVMATVVWTAWACLRMREQPSHLNAAIAGVSAAAACLTRITALVFVLPALVWVVVDSPRDLRRARARAAGVAMTVIALLVAPYLISCAIATGDPFFAINYHTVYYRHADAMPTEGTMSAAEYIRTKFAAHPVRMFDVGITGLVVRPFANKWGGLQPLLGAAQRWVVWAAVAGLLLLPWHAPGRLLLVVLFSSLLPYAFTWNIGDGGAWRFTMHAYPIYLVAACYAGARLAQLATTVVRRRWTMPRVSRQMAASGAVFAVLALAAPCAYGALPWLIVRESLARGEDTNVDTGERDGMFYVQGWSDPRAENIMVRFSLGDRSIVRVPLPAAGAYAVALRMDPVLPDGEQRVSVLFNRHFVARFALTLTPDRVGTYRFQLQPHQVRAGSNELTLIPETVAAASAAGPRFAWLPPDAQVGFRLWYVRILPLK